MANLITSTNLTGQHHVLGQNDIDNYAAIVQQIGGDEFARDVNITYNNSLITGSIAAFIDNGEVKFALSFDRSVVLPAGVCINVLMNSEEVNQFMCMTDKVRALKKLKLLALDEDGCPIGYVTVGDILKLVDIPNICDQMNIGDGNLVSGDKLLVVNDNCDFKSIPASDIACE